MNYFIVAGEHSGDIYGGYLIEQIKLKDKKAQLMGVGGSNMKAAGADIILPSEALAVMGFWEILRKLFFFKKALNLCKEQIIAFQTDVLVLIDFPGFNLRLAKWAKRRGFKVIYYIPPKVWAWREKRRQILQDSVDELLLVLPFESDYYAQHNICHNYVGHPLIEKMLRTEEQVFNISNDNIIAVMPGSRKQEVKKMMALMLRVAVHFPEYVFFVIKASNLPDALYEPILKEAERRNKLRNIIATRTLTGNILKKARLAIVKSGTATLEACLHNLPQIVCYRTSWITYQIARRVVKVAHVSLPNLIAGKEIVPELIQSTMKADEIAKYIRRLTSNAEGYKDAMLDGYKEVHQRLHFKPTDSVTDLISSGSLASQKAAAIVTKLARRN